MTNKYQTPLASRYASEYMLNLFSSDTRYRTWRKLWVSLAKAQKELGLPISQVQIDEMEANINNIDYDCVQQFEKEMKHDVMAHVHAFGKTAPAASGIIHLGATSCYVTDNADLIIYRSGLKYLRSELLKIISLLAELSKKFKDVPTLGYTHYQPAQLVTVGKRAALWLQDFTFDLEEIDFVIDNLKFLGCRGTTGTEASFLELFRGDSKKIDAMNQMICKDFEFDSCYSVSGQTYPRKVDSRILNCLSSVAQSCYKMANDIRLLQHDRQIEESFKETQVGSSAMPYKRNPMKSERICSLSRYLMVDSLNAAFTASSQWLERTLDDSANRRISLPEGFLCADAILRLSQNVVSGLKVNENIIKKSVNEYLPFIATENLMMEAVKKGADRQHIHEIIRRCSMRTIEEMNKGASCNLLRYLSEEREFGLTYKEMQDLLDPKNYIGRSVEQVELFTSSLQDILNTKSIEIEEIEI